MFLWQDFLPFQAVHIPYPGGFVPMQDTTAKHLGDGVLNLQKSKPPNPLTPCPFFLIPSEAPLGSW